ncbi:alkaline phosphatase family protein [Bacillus sp. ISL-18]|uniref:alkaline phosphatase family protein n=1 Tax=Bacillus sp. ISL-18 TaxID=2819118 RepID=UPI00203582CD|nr:alkaline phosphatase family protein [Bacillus sp. ISL-18]
MRKNWKFLFVGIMLLLTACNQNEPKNQTTQKKTVHKEEEKANLPKIDHILIVVEENHSKSQIENNSSAPYMNSLMKQGANFTNYHAIQHPSQPNYLALFSGSNQGVTDDKMPKSKFSAANLASELIEKNYSFKGYSEGQPSVGYDKESAGNGYARKHNPWANFTNVPKESNQPFKNFPKDFSTLPTVSFVIPNLDYDMHDGTIQDADQWLKDNIDPYVQWANTHNSLLIVTWDEDEGSNKNIIPTFFVGPMVKPEVYNENVNHYNLLRTIEDIYGLSHAGQAKNSQPIMSSWK